MAANVETMFSASNELPWHKLGTIIKEAVSSDDAIHLAGLDWIVKPEPIYDSRGIMIPNYKVNIRQSDNKILGVVTNRYKIVQNVDAFAFTDALLGEGVKYETAGSLASGKRVWLLAKLDGTTLCDEKIDPYLVFTNTFDGSGAIRVAITPIRVVCMNTLNLALSRASRQWSCQHKGDIMGKLEEAKYTLTSAENYLEALQDEFWELKKKKLTDKKVEKLTDELIKIEFNSLYKYIDKDTNIISLKEHLSQQKAEAKIKRKKADILNIYHYKPDLQDVEKSAFRFVNAISDYVNHTTDHKNTKNYQENLFMRTIDGHSMIDMAHKLAIAI